MLAVGVDVGVGVGAGVGLGVVITLIWRVAAFDVTDGASADVRREEPWPQDARSRRRNGSRRWIRLRGWRLADWTLRPHRGSGRRGLGWLRHWSNPRMVPSSTPLRTVPNTTIRVVNQELTPYDQRADQQNGGDGRLGLTRSTAKEHSKAPISPIRKPLAESSNLPVGSGFV